MNTFKVHHYDSTGLTWEEISSPIFPFSFGDYLDERLDEAYVTFYSTVENYKTTDVFKVEIFEEKILKKTTYYICGNDEAEEIPIGSSNYKHKLFLMEPTKLTEGVVCQTLTFTNDLLVSNPSQNSPDVESYPSPSNPEEYSIPKQTNNVTPVSPGEKIFILSPYDMANLNLPYKNTLVDSFSASEESSGFYTIYSKDGKFDDSKTLSGKKNAIVELDIGQRISVFYNMICVRTFPLPTGVWSFTLSYDIYCSNGALVPYTITTMTKRVLELAEPLEHWRGNKKPRFVFDGIQYGKSGVFDEVTYKAGSQAEKYDKIRADEITLTQATLREQLKAVAGLVHCEPRVEISESTNGGKTTLNYTVKYEPYDKAKEATSLKDKKYSYKKISCSINEYCTELRSNVQNLVNAMNYGKGVLADPTPFEYSSIRPTSVNERVKESNGKAATTLPIYKIIKVMCGVYKIDDKGYIIRKKDESNNQINEIDYAIKPIDITFFVCEKAAYDLKSTFSNSEIIAKNYFIYYTQGQKNIEGLFYKPSAANSIEQFYERPAIVNILSIVTQTSHEDVNNSLIDKHAGLFFQITYIPIYPALLSHGKQKYIAGETKFAQVYNQSENLVEAHYYGENIKGAAARLGNVEQERTYILNSIKDIPVIGQTVDGYSIAAVLTEVYPYYYKCTLALSKDFNRINPYVGISSNKRVYEVSEKEAYERSILYKEYIVISRETNLPTNNGIFARKVKKFVEALAYDEQSAPDYPPVSFVTSIFRMRNEIIKDQNDKEPIPAQASIALPVVASAFGNSILFSWAYKDNYSAGEQMKYTSEDGIKGFWSKDVPYGNYYGRGDFYGFNLLRKKPDKWPENAPFNLPQIPTAYTEPDLGIQARTAVFKDSREKLSFNLEFEFKTTEDDLIIGSGAASCCWLVDTTPRKPVLKLFHEPIGKLQQTVIGTSDYKGTYGYTVDEAENGEYATITFPSNISLTNYASWALCFPIDESDEMFTDEYGDTKTFKQQRGGEIFIAGNGKFPEKLYISIQHE